VLRVFVQLFIYCIIDLMGGTLQEALRRLEKASASASGSQLPAIRKLAASWGMSARTVQLAVAEAVRQGWLETRQGSGTWPRGARPEVRMLPSKMDCRRLVETIGAEIREGKYASGQALPAPKVLAQRYGIHPATVRKAFAMLQSQGAAERHGRTWTVSVPHSPRGGGSSVVLCIGAADAEGNLRMDTDREWDFWREIQVEAIRCGLEPRLVPWSDALPDLDGAFGAVVSTWHLTDSAPLLDALLRVRLPTAVWIANHEHLPGKRYRQARSLWFHDQAFGREAGRTMARYVAGCEYRKIAWISPFHGSAWSRNRLAGFREELPEGIELIEANREWVSEWDVQKDVFRDPEVLARLDLSGIDHGGSVGVLARPLVEAITRDRCLGIFGPALETALESGASLWVVASDIASLWCWHWLRARDVRIPEGLAMMSFDDSREASRIGLTSLRFDVQGMARAMIRQILSSRQPHPLLTRYAGAVIGRRSSSLRP
jgi:DNA-binding transcriptional regulator YhcF (GntR family)